MGIVYRSQRRRSSFSKLLMNYGQSTALVGACVVFIACFLGQQTVRSQFFAASTVSEVDGTDNHLEMGSPDSQTGSMPSAVESVVTTNPVLPAAEAKPVAVNSLPVVKPDSTLPVSEPAPVDPEDPHATQPKSDPATDGSEEPHAMKTAATDPEPASTLEKSEAAPDNPEDPHAVKTEATSPDTQNKAPLDLPKPTQTLAQYLNFSENTRLNFMHFHKTGGVSYKIALYGFFGNRKKADGTIVRVRDACYEQEWKGSTRWQCNWEPVWKMAPAERAKIDVFFGHQYRWHGVDEFLKGRDVRTFAIMRHPFARKVSFFYHFLVRKRNRKEDEVPFSELRDFLLREKIPDDARAGHDKGPNYMAGRLLSTSDSDFVGDRHRRHYEVPPEKEEQVVRESKEIIRSYVFIGLQAETDASVCMLKKTVEAFSEVHGIVNPDMEKIARDVPRNNAGSYKMTAEMAWEKLTPDEQKAFIEEERVDLAIYEEGLKMFRKHVKRFKCEHLVKSTQLSR